MAFSSLQPSFFPFQIPIVSTGYIQTITCDRQSVNSYLSCFLIYILSCLLTVPVYNFFRWVFFLLVPRIACIQNSSFLFLSKLCNSVPLFTEVLEMTLNK